MRVCGGFVGHSSTKFLAGLFGGLLACSYLASKQAQAPLASQKLSFACGYIARPLQQKPFTGGFWQWHALCTGSGRGSTPPHSSPSKPCPQVPAIKFVFVFDYSGFRAKCCVCACRTGLRFLFRKAKGGPSSIKIALDWTKSIISPNL